MSGILDQVRAGIEATLEITPPVSAERRSAIVDQIVEGWRRAAEQLGWIPTEGEQG